MDAKATPELGIFITVAEASGLMNGDKNSNNKSSNISSNIDNAQREVDEEEQKKKEIASRFRVIRIATIRFLWET